jgi:hypothetical protein
MCALFTAIAGSTQVQRVRRLTPSAYIAGGHTAGLYRVILKPCSANFLEAHASLPCCPASGAPIAIRCFSSCHVHFLHSFRSFGGSAPSDSAVFGIRCVPNLGRQSNARKRLWAWVVPAHIQFAIVTELYMCLSWA